ncbi:MAG TPA: S41 family peptidase [Burkholderiales bacterium]|nr:S41 family peptidase [Burkholderiales bacterium]
MGCIGPTAAKGFRLGFALAIFVQAAPLAIADQAEKFDAVREFSEAYDQIKSRYADRLDEKLLVSNAIKGMVAALDPFSYYLEPDAYNELRLETGGVFGGLGMEVSLEKGAVKVITAFEDSPAHRAGLQSGDLITRFGETDVAGLTLEQAIQHARGEPDSSIALTVLSKGIADPRVVTVKRAIVQARSVKSKTIDSAYFYLKITHFHKHTAESMIAALAGGYQQTGGLKGVILDLRDNPGGVLKSAVGVSATFLPEDALVVYTESASEQSRMRLLAKPAYVPGGEDYSTLRTALKIVPLVVLVNGSSASAAEVVAGALQGHGRATIVGTRTFGKGSVQVVLPLSAGSALKLTTAYYSTPDGRKIQGTGLMPDIAVEQSSIGGACSEAAAVGAPAAKVLTEPPANVAPAEVDCQFDRAVEILRRLRNLVES